MPVRAYSQASAKPLPSCAAAQAAVDSRHKPGAASPATSIQLTLDLSPVDVTHADGREILVNEPPAYMLHMWDKGELVSHTAMAGDFPAAVYYTQPFIKGAA